MSTSISHTPIRSLAQFSRSIYIPAPTRILTRPQTSIPHPSILLSLSQSSPFSTTSTQNARKGRGPQAPKDKKVTLIRYFLYHPLEYAPRPLKVSRLRYLRHWTINRAWQLYQHKLRTARDNALQRQYQAMSRAMEELRLHCGEAGARLYRQANTRKGTWGGRSDLGLVEGKDEGENKRVAVGREGGVPIEYGRGLVDRPSKNGWNETWRRA